MRAAVHLRAHAKINLYLEVGSLRSDGFHEIRSVMHNISLADKVGIAPGGGIEVVCDDPAVPDGEANLAWKAAALLREETGVGHGCSIRIEKKIPAAAGLGGGSADAAAVLVGLSHLWELHLPTMELAELGARLGSDVPFFLYGGAAVATGRGEQIKRRAPLSSDIQFLLVTPSVEVSSSFAYKELDQLRLTRSPTEIKIGSTPDSGSDWEEILRSPYNHLEEAVLATYPLVLEARDRATQLCPTGAIMSGSGPSVFGLLPEERDGVDVDLLSEFSGCRFAEIVRPVPHGIRFDVESGDVG